jgi:hypothetical protein
LGAVVVDDELEACVNWRQTAGRLIVVVIGGGGASGVSGVSGVVDDDGSALGNNVETLSSG